jgi:ribosome-binding factor A
MMGDFNRGVRMENVIRDELDVIFRCEIGDPLLATVHITHVELSARGARARAWFQIGQLVELDAVERALERACGFLRVRLAEALGNARVPELVFRRDPAAQMEGM